MLFIYIFRETFDLCIENFDQVILWLSILMIFGTIITSACLSSFAPTLYYEVKSGKKENCVIYFSIFDLQLPYKSRMFNEIILKINPKTQKIITKSLKMDNIFMPFAYTSIFLLITHFYLLSREYNSAIFPMFPFLQYALILPFIAYLCDIGENYLTKKLIYRVQKLQAEEVGHIDERLEIENSLNRLINHSKLKIYAASSIKWITVIYCILVIFCSFFLQFF
ncbi:hypothetical protein [Chryseobacterium sp. PET-29]|uniref:hypothetical protein n=1 Tax=Chryseobacterium sp. PET-29 TaxID=2983267 RepID=UPI0021E61B3D|nr:hypothetical protein [Chryseobacterium sp. PET-29]